MIYTGYFARLNGYISMGLRPISVAGKSPEFYMGDKLGCFAPTREMYNAWKYGSISDEEYAIRYINERLEPLDLSFMKGLDEVVLLCYEKEGFCHRHILREWLNTKGFEVNEVPSCS